MIPYFLLTSGVAALKYTNLIQVNHYINLLGLGQLETHYIAIKKANGKRTIPQIFFNDYHVGGFDDLIEHDMDGKLTDLLR